MNPRILVPFDFSDSATAALSWAAELQATTKPEEAIHLIHVIGWFPSSDPTSAVEMLLPTEDETKEVERQLAGAASRAGARAVVDVIVRPVPVGETIVDIAEQLHADLIVMGTHGRTGISRLILGSVAEHVIRHAPCPVVTMRAGRVAAPA